MRYDMTCLPLLLSLLMLTACASEEPPVAPQSIKAFVPSLLQGKGDGLNPSLIIGAPLKLVPDAQSVMPWGGPTPGAWSPEARLANAASQEINRAWAHQGAVDVIVAIPLKLQESAIHPFGDGQSNAAASLNGWPHERPPLIGVLTLRSGLEPLLELRLDSRVPFEGSSLVLEFKDLQGQPYALTLGAQRDARGDLSGAWVLPSGLDWDQLLAPQAAKVRPLGWSDAFPLYFRHPARHVDRFMAELPAHHLELSLGRSLPDPESLGVEGLAQAPSSSFERALAHTWGPGYNSSPYLSQTVHGGVEGRATSTSSAWSWVIGAPHSTNKHVYLCLSARDEPQEAALGVPSGAGWHKIGDPAETLFNTLEDEPLLVAWAIKSPGAPGGSPWGLEDVATFRLLQPLETFTTASGASDSQLPSVANAQYHWYGVHQAEPICVEILVHACVPNQDAGYRCAPAAIEPPGAAQLTLKINAYTSWGQQLYVVGSSPQLGQWDPSKALKLEPLNYPQWSVTFKRAVDEPISFKFIKKSGDAVIWEGGANHELSPQQDVTNSYMWRD